VDRVDGEKRAYGGNSSRTPPPPRIGSHYWSTTPPTTIAPPVIVEIVVKVVLNVVVNFDAAIVPKIVNLILVIVPFRFVDGVGWVPVVPKVLVVRPLIVSIFAEVIQFRLVVGTPFIPVVLTIFDCLIPLRGTIFGPIGEFTLIDEPISGTLIESPREVSTGGATLDLVREFTTTLTRKLAAAFPFSSEIRKIPFIAPPSRRRAVSSC
jgi:hypothetical protein